MFCKKCGNEIKEGSKFCSKCGEPINSNSIPATDNTYDPVSASETDENHKGLKIGIFVLIIVLLSIIVGSCIFFWISENKENNFFEKMNHNSEDYEEDDVNQEYPDKEKDDQDDTDEENLTEEQTDEEKEFTGIKKNVNIEIHQFDNSGFPDVILYASILDDDGNTVETMKKSDFTVKEILSNGKTVDTSVEDVYRVLDTDSININMVLDASGSMSSDNKIAQAKNAANAFINYMEFDKGNKVEIISFDDYVYLQQDFTNSSDMAIAAVDGIALGGSTALYDALYAGLYQTYYERGAKCVIAFTDGMENASSYTYDDVVEMARNTGIPVYIVGIGEEYDAGTYQQLAQECSGRYYSANTTELENILEDIYISIYEEQQDYYVVKYKTTNKDNLTEFRNIVLETSENSGFSGSYQKEYVPETDITGAFSASYINKDYMIDDSSTRLVTDRDLAGMSLAELRIARNEIFARHGRQFKDAMLNQWFYSKVWYLNISPKYSPNDFDANNPNPLSQLELENANFIKAYEDNIMNTQFIYPDAANAELSDYDLALSKPVLKKALEQMEGYSSTNILEENKKRLQDAMSREDVQY